MLLENLTLKLIGTPYINQFIYCKITIWNATNYVTVVCKLQSQSSKEFDEFLLNFDNYWTKLKCWNLFILWLLWNYNARSRSWWADNITSCECSHTKSLRTINRFHKLMQDPIHFLIHLHLLTSYSQSNKI